MTEEHGYIHRGVHHWRGEDPLPLQGVPIPAGHDEFSEENLHLLLNYPFMTTSIAYWPIIIYEDVIVTQVTKKFTRYFYV